MRGRSLEREADSDECKSATARDANASGPASSPTLGSSEATDLAALVTELRDMIADLRDNNAQLRADLADARRVVPAPKVRRVRAKDFSEA